VWLLWSFPLILYFKQFGMVNVKFMYVVKSACTAFVTCWQMLTEMKECHAWHVAHWSQAHHILHACTIDKIVLLKCWRVHTKYVDDTIVRPELWAALEGYTTVCYLHNLSLHSVVQVNTTVDKNSYCVKVMFMLDLHLLNSFCFSRHYNYYLVDEFTAVFVRTLAGV